MRTRSSLQAEQVPSHHATHSTQFKSSAKQVLDARDIQSVQRKAQDTASHSSAVSQLKLLQAKMSAKADVTQRVEDEEPVQGKFDAVQRVEDEEPVQGKFDAVQRVEDEEAVQGKFAAVQRVEEEEPIQGKFAVAQRLEDEEPAQAKFGTAQLEGRVQPNNTGLPNQLKAGIESLSGMSMDHVKVHYNSSQPAQLNAHAYAQGSEIHVAPGQEQHLPHEAWHVVQQAQGRVRPTTQMKQGVPVNDDAGLESEADVMGAKAIAGDHIQAKTLVQNLNPMSDLKQKKTNASIAQRFSDLGAVAQLYSYSAGTTKKVTLINAGGTDQTDINVCTQNSVTYAANDTKQTGTGTGTASWAGWLTDAGNDHNATQLHVVNRLLGGNGGPTEGNIGPGSQNLNSHHLHQAEKYVKDELFSGGKATHGFTYACSFDYSNSVDKVHNTPTAKGKAINDPAIKAKVTFTGTAPTVQSTELQALVGGVDVTNGYNMKFGKA